MSKISLCAGVLLLLLVGRKVKVEISRARRLTYELEVSVSG